MREWNSVGRPAVAAIVRLALVVMMVGVAGTPAPAQVPDPYTDPYIVRGLSVDVTADSASAARARALEQAEREAFARLYRRLTAAGAGGPVPEVGDDALDELIQGVEIEREQSSAVRYVAELAVRFWPDAVTAFLEGEGVAAVAPPDRPVVVVPVVRRAGAPLLWEDRTEWRNAWEAAMPAVGLLPIVVPFGDLGDIAAISAEEALDGDRGGLERIAAQHDADDVIVAVLEAVAGPLPSPALPDPTHDGSGATGVAAGVAATWYRGGTEVARERFPRPDGALTQAVARVGRWMEQVWKSDTTSPAAAPLARGTLQVLLTAGSLTDWVRARRGLEAEPLVERAEPVALAPRRGQLAVVHRGTPEDLAAALARRGLRLTRADPATLAAVGGAVGRTAPGWVLRFDAALPATAPQDPFALD